MRAWTGFSICFCLWLFTHYREGETGSNSLFTVSNIMKVKCCFSWIYSHATLPDVKEKAGSNFSQQYRNQTAFLQLQLPQQVRYGTIKGSKVPLLEMASLGSVHTLSVPVHGWQTIRGSGHRVLSSVPLWQILERYSFTLAPNPS